MSHNQFLPKISIIIPVYNGENYLQKAIDTAVNQTYPNIEVIVVNDGSNDDGKTEKIALSYRNRIKYFAKKQGYVASALNYGIGKMTGEYFSWLSHDDEYYEVKIEEQIKTLQSLENKQTILYSSYDLIDESSKFITTVNLSDILDYDQLNNSLVPLLRGMIHGCTLLIHKDLFAEYGLFSEKLRFTQDYFLWHKFLINRPIKFIDKRLIKSRVHQEQDSKKFSEIRVKEVNDLWKFIIDNTPDHKKIECEGSIYAFYRRLYIFLKNAGDEYKETSEYAKNKADQEFGNSLISIIIPVYNRINFAVEALQSAVDQTYKNIEIIVVDDGSEENTEPIKQLAQKHSQVRFYRTENRGASAARNFAISKAKGEYIAFLDADDIFLPDKIEKQYYKMVEDDCHISHSSYPRIDENGQEIELMNFTDMKGKVFPRIITMCTIATPTVMLNKAILGEKKFDERINVGEDICLWIDLLHNRKLSMIAEPLTKVRYYSESTSNNNEQVLNGMFNILFHCLHNEEYSKHKKEIYHLLKSITYIFSLLLGEVAVDSPRSLELSPQVLVASSPRSLYDSAKRIFDFYHAEGLKKTLQKISKKIGKKLLRICRIIVKAVRLWYKKKTQL